MHTSVMSASLKNNNVHLNLKKFKIYNFYKMPVCLFHKQKIGSHSFLIYKCQEYVKLEAKKSKPTLFNDLLHRVLMVKNYNILLLEQVSAEYSI